jgi:hypothetical protein
MLRQVPLHVDIIEKNIKRGDCFRNLVPGKGPMVEQNIYVDEDETRQEKANRETKKCLKKGRLTQLMDTNGKGEE